MVEWRIRRIGSCSGKHDGEWWISLWKWNRYELDVGISLEVFSVFAVFGLVCLHIVVLTLSLTLMNCLKHESKTMRETYII